MHAFGNWAVEQLRDEGAKELSEYPEEHHGFIAKLVHESCVIFLADSSPGRGKLTIRRILHGGADLCEQEPNAHGTRDERQEHAQDGDRSQAGDGVRRLPGSRRERVGRGQSRRCVSLGKSAPGLSMEFQATLMN